MKYDAGDEIAIVYSNSEFYDKGALGYIISVEDHNINLVQFTSGVFRVISGNSDWFVHRSEMTLVKKGEPAPITVDEEHFVL